MQFIKPNTKYPFIAKSKPFLVGSAVVVTLMLLLPFWWVVTAPP